MGSVFRRATLVLAVAIGAFVLWLAFVWPPPFWWRTHWPARTAFMAMRARQERSAGRVTPRRYSPLPLDSMSRWLPKAAVAGEDEAFYQHHGVDYHAVREALGYRRATFRWGDAADRAELWHSLAHAWERRDRLRGASTITQQLAKNLYLSPSRNPLRKLKEAAVAYRLEWALDKSRIMELYLNVAEFGPNLWGVEAASERYFGEPARRLSAEDAALLVATLPHPLTSNPSYRPGRTEWREQLILLKLGGAPVVVPPEETEDTVPPLLLVPDTLVPADTAGRDTIPSPNDSAAVPPLPRDTAAAPPTGTPPAAPGLR